MTSLRSIWADLAAPFDDSEVKSRPGPGGRELHYVDARAVAQRLDDVVTPLGWNFEATVIPGSDIVKGRLTIWPPAREPGDRTLTVREDHGYPNSDRDEEPIKAATSDALKRCAVLFGIGRHLYDDNRQGTGRAVPLPVRPAAPRSTTALPDGDVEFDQLSPTPPGQSMTFKELVDRAEAAGKVKNDVYHTADKLFGRNTKVTELDGGARYAIAVEMDLA